MMLQNLLLPSYDLIQNSDPFQSFHLYTSHFHICNDQMAEYFLHDSWNLYLSNYITEVI